VELRRQKNAEVSLRQVQQNGCLEEQVKPVNKLWDENGGNRVLKRQPVAQA
jgi:hypothetical protein